MPTLTREQRLLYDGRRQAFLRNIKATTPCADCGIQYPHWVMEFDHLRDKKHVVAQSKTWKALFAELEKCEVVCANCHATRTHYRRVANEQSIR